jgi:hypothetical protein
MNGENKGQEKQMTTKPYALNLTQLNERHSTKSKDI